MQYSDEELVERYGAGDGESFRMLVERYQDRVYHIVYGIVGNKDEAEDLSQEVFLRVYRFLHRFKGKSRFYTWLYRLTVNVCLSARRKRKNEPGKIFSLANSSKYDDDPGEIELADESLSPLKVLQNREMAETIKSAINSLSEVLKSTFVLREFEELSYEELARVFRCSRGTIKSRLSRAREQLRRKIEPYLNGTV
ncbi:sigma-70 family RNA polymerase sigma factor [Candidatus Aerophobetes bacterium]|nr:sigma-70 family RNA polymerase sigma factor [Candidatus Aerophobetes bacterium]